jgi:hypothetical protein
VTFAGFTRLALWGWEIGLFNIKPIDLIPYFAAYCQGHGGKWNEEEFLAGYVEPVSVPEPEVVYW